MEGATESHQEPQWNLAIQLCLLSWMPMPTSLQQRSQDFLQMHKCPRYQQSLPAGSEAVASPVFWLLETGRSLAISFAPWRTWVMSGDSRDVTAGSWVLVTLSGLSPQVLPHT